MEDVPLAFQPYFEIYSDREFPYVIFDPAERTFATRVHAKVICVLNDEVRVYEKEKSQVKETCIKVKDVNYVEFGTILLYSWITVNLIAGSGFPNLTLVFNNTAEPLYKPVIDRLRSMRLAEGDVAAAEKAEEERDKFDFLITKNHKFMNFGRKSIEPGEQVREILFQPEIKVPYLKLFGKTYYKAFLKTSLIVLTNTELILIKEPENTRTVLAGVKCFASLGKIKHVNVENPDDLKKCILEIVFDDESHLCAELEHSKYGEAKNIAESLRMQTNVSVGA